MFWLNALAGAVLLAVLLAWRRPTVRAERRERFLPALRSGVRYVRHEPAVVAILVRFGAFVFPAGAVWALLPLIANHQLGLDAGGYGVLFSALGVGAVCGALGLGPVKQRLTSSTILTSAGLAFAAAFLALAFTETIWQAVPLLVVCGLAWSASVATVVSELQLFVPGWVRARVIAIYLMVFLGIQSVAAPIWELVTGQFGLRTALVLAGAVGVVTALACSRMPVPDGHSMQRTPVVFWDAPQLQVEPASPSGPVLVVNRYRVDSQNQAGFVEAMGGLRGSRLRSGASKWSLYQVGEKSGWFVEQFLVSSWEEHERQHDGRLTVEDRDIEEKALALTTERGSPEHLLPARRSAP